MRKFFLAAFTVLITMLFAACGTTKSMYSWYSYQTDYYHYEKNADEDSLKELIQTYEKIIAKQSGTRGVVPPGIYADYGYVLIQSGKTKEGKAMLEKEVELYPESKVFVSSLLKRVEK